jgi:CheY-like chemotaxis protein
MNQLSCLLVTGDLQLESAVRTALERSNVAVRSSTTADRALQVMRTQHFDGLIVDCEGYTGLGLIKAIRNGRSNSQSAILAVVDERADTSPALASGANFALKKPVSGPRLDAYLNVGLVFLNREFRRYYRHKVDLPLTVVCQGVESNATIANVSQGGLGIRTAGLVKLEGAVEVRFTPPEIGSEIVAKGEVAWASQRGQAGIRLLSMSAPSAEAFDNWLLLLDDRTN